MGINTVTPNLTIDPASGQWFRPGCINFEHWRLLGALYLTPLDRRMETLCKRKQLVHYVRYMDDIVLLARTRWQLRRAIAALHEEIAPLGLHLHRVKRFIGRTAQGFDFLGYRIRAGARLRPSAEGLRRLRERARRLHEREGDRHRLRQYVLRWQRWHWGGLHGIKRPICPACQERVCNCPRSDKKLVEAAGIEPAPRKRKAAKSQGSDS